MRHEEGGFSAGSVLLSFLLGGMVGAGLALLLAPQSGVETRKRIREFTDDVREKVTEYVGQTKEKVVSTVEKGKHLVEEKKSALTAAFEAGKEAYEKEVHK
ncbi:YtxH domain-containing protein [Dissulfurispira sp.]|uniref:YtxH domain-containing protein n=1 Tax=Dissulfurispira sp. TaxID=2817609 RepID=UPI002FDA5802